MLPIQTQGSLLVMWLASYQMGFPPIKHCALLGALTVHTVSRTRCTASGQYSDGAGIQPVYTPFRSVLNKRRWRLGPPAGDFSMGWMPLL